MNIIKTLWYYHIDSLVLLLAVLFISKPKLLCCLKNIISWLLNIALLIFWGICYYIRLIWFLGVLIFSTYFCYVNWENIVSFTPITSYSIMYLLFIFLLLYPLILSLKIGQVESQFYDIFQNKKAKDEYNKRYNKLSNNNDKKDVSESYEKKIDEIIDSLKNNDNGGENV